MKNIFGHISDWFSAHVAPYWSPAGLIQTTPPQKWFFEKGYIALLVILLIGGIALLFARKMRPGLRERLSSFCWNSLVLGLVLFFLRYQQIPLLGMDLWRFIQEIAMIVWLVTIYRYWRLKVPAETMAERVAAHKEKYLPKAKKA